MTVTAPTVTAPTVAAPTVTAPAVTALHSSRYHCTSCRLEPADDAGSGGARRHCEVCGAWVTAPRGALGRDLDLSRLRAPA